MIAKSIRIFLFKDNESTARKIKMAIRDSFCLSSLLIFIYDMILTWTWRRVLFITRKQIERSIGTLNTNPIQMKQLLSEPSFSFLANKDWSSSYTYYILNLSYFSYERRRKGAATATKQLVQTLYDAIRQWESGLSFSKGHFLIFSTLRGGGVPCS